MYAIGLDIGGTKITGAVVGVNGAVHRRERLPTPAHDFESFRAAVFSLIDILARDFDGHVVGLGVSAPGIIDKHGTFLFGGGSLPYLKGVNFIKLLRGKYDLPVISANDHNCFALAEAVFGAGRNHAVVAGVIWGTGVGVGLIVNQKIFAGENGAAGEIGHVVLAPDHRGECACQKHGCLEQLASGRAISERYRALGGKISHAGPYEIYYSDEPAAKVALKQGIYYLAQGLAMITAAYNPGVIVLGGGVSKLPDPVYDALQGYTKEFLAESLWAGFNLKRFEVADDAGVIGAAILAFRAASGYLGD